jgi:carbon storage regulator
MLVFTRKAGERIQLGDQITVTVVKISGNMVRLGIEAPEHMGVVRQELVLRAVDQAPSDNPAEESAAHQA